MSTINALAIRRSLGKKEWAVPRPFGEDGWLVERFDGRARIIVTASPAPGAEEDFSDWVHASISRPGMMPTYSDLTALHKAVWPDGYAYQVFAPPSQHVNIHPYALHIWGKADGSPVLPEFGMFGTI